MIDVAKGLHKVSKPSWKNQKRYEIKFAIVQFTCRNNRATFNLGVSFLTSLDSQFPLYPKLLSKKISE